MHLIVNLNKKLNKNKLKIKTIIDSQNNKQITKRMCDILSMTTETYCKYKRSFQCIPRNPIEQVNTGTYDILIFGKRYS